jgi:hypothetical protein
VGWLCDYALIVTCGKCGTSLSGHVNSGQEHIGLGLEFDNATILKGDGKEGYLLECSGEFPTFKQSAVENSDIFIITPFIRMMQRMKEDNSYDSFCKSLSMLNETAIKWKDYKRIL